MEVYCHEPNHGPQRLASPRQEGRQVQKPPFFTMAIGTAMANSSGKL